MFLNSNKGYPRQLIKTDGRCPTNMFVGQGVPLTGAPIGRVIPGTDFTTLPEMISNIRTKMNSLNWSNVGLTKPSVIYATMVYTDEGEDSFPSMVYLYRSCDSLTNDRIPLPQLMASGGLSAANSVWEAANSYTDIMDFGDVRFVSSVGNTTQGSNAIRNPEAMSLSRSDGKYIWLFPGFNVMRTWCLNCTNCPYTDTYASMQCGNMVQTAVQVGNRVLIKDYIGSEAYKNGIYEITQKNVVYYDDNPACTSPESRGSLRVSCGPTYIATVTLKLARISNFNNGLGYINPQVRHVDDYSNYWANRSSTISWTTYAKKYQYCTIWNEGTVGSGDEASNTWTCRQTKYLSQNYDDRASKNISGYMPAAAGAYTRQMHTMAIYLNEDEEFSYCMLPNNYSGSCLSGNSSTDCCVALGDTGDSPKTCTPYWMNPTVTGNKVTACKAWLESLPDSSTDASVNTKQSLMNEYCTVDNWGALPDCDCEARSQRRAYSILQGSPETADLDMCWWLPCKNSNGSRWISPLTSSSVSSDSCGVCVNIVNLSNFSDVVIGEINQYATCARDASDAEASAAAQAWMPFVNSSTSMPERVVYLTGVMCALGLMIFATTFVVSTLQASDPYEKTWADALAELKSERSLQIALGFLLGTMLVAFFVFGFLQVQDDSEAAQVEAQAVARREAEAQALAKQEAAVKDRERRMQGLRGAEAAIREASISRAVSRGTAGPRLVISGTAAYFGHLGKSLRAYEDGPSPFTFSSRVLTGVLDDTYVAADAALFPELAPSCDKERLLVHSPGSADSALGALAAARASVKWWQDRPSQLFIRGASKNGKTPAPTDSSGNNNNPPSYALSRLAPAQASHRASAGGAEEQVERTAFLLKNSKPLLVGINTRTRVFWVPKLPESFTKARGLGTTAEAGAWVFAGSFESDLDKARWIGTLQGSGDWFAVTVPARRRRDGGITFQHCEAGKHCSISFS